jgi:hypothetical protein
MIEPPPDGVSCEAVVETVTLWVAAEDRPDELILRALQQSPESLPSMRPDSLQKMWSAVVEGMGWLEKEEADAFTLRALMPPLIQWDPDPGVVKVRMWIAVWTFASREAFGTVGETVSHEICRLYYQQAMCPYVEASLRWDLRAPSKGPSRGPALRAADALRRCLARFRTRLPMGAYHDLFARLAREGEEFGEAFRQVRERMLAEVKDEIRGLYAERRERGAAS